MFDEAMLRVHEKFFNLLFTTHGSGGGGCVFASRSFQL